jgi:glyoxylase-like metal-dependent hydrolase (beta-lactamase superfamily II)
VFLDWSGVADGELRRTWMQVLLGQFHYRPRRPAGFLVPGEIIALDGLTVDLVHTPGHARGHLTFLFREPGILSMGDYDLTSFGPCYGDRYSDSELTIESMNRLRQIEATTGFTSHEQGLFTENPGELWDRYLGVIEQREQKLLDALAQPRTLDEIDEIADQWLIYGRPREPVVFHQFADRALTSKHLERLEARGVVKTEQGGYGIADG